MNNNLFNIKDYVVVITGGELRSKLLFEEKVFTGVAGTNTIRLLPPLCLSMDEAKDFMARFAKLV